MREGFAAGYPTHDALQRIACVEMEEKRAVDPGVEHDRLLLDRGRACPQPASRHTRAWKLEAGPPHPEGTPRPGGARRLAEKGPAPVNPPGGGTCTRPGRSRL